VEWGKLEMSGKQLNLQAGNMLYSLNKYY